MPIDYSAYHPEWKTVIRPDILRRAKDRCEFCLVPNYAMVFRGYWNDAEVYQTVTGEVFDAGTGKNMLCKYEGICAEIEPKSGNPEQRAIKVILTIMHLDHDIKNNCYSNLAAGCQRCHNRHDAKHRARNRRTDPDQKELFK